MPEEHEINYQKEMDDSKYTDAEADAAEKADKTVFGEARKQEFKEKKPISAGLKEKMNDVKKSYHKFMEKPERWVKDYVDENKENRTQEKYRSFVNKGADSSDVHLLMQLEEILANPGIGKTKEEENNIKLRIEAQKRKIKLQMKQFDALNPKSKGKTGSIKLPKALISNGAAMIGNKGTIGMDFNVVPSHTTMGQSATNYSAPNVTPAYNRRPNVDPVVRFENQMKYQQSQEAIRYMQQKRAVEIAQRERARELQAHMRAEQERAHAMRYKPEARRTNIMSFATPKINNIVGSSNRFTMPNVTTRVNMGAFKQTAPKARKSSGTSGTSHIVGNINRMFSSGRKKFAGVSTGVKKGGFNFGIKMPNIAGNLKKFTTRKKRTKKGGKK